ncbi:MAG: Rhodanese-like protein [uncultured Thiotrichaceae bacterium]|uniref:Rhodanese-like protein n=1 Tax=uncultured Thiotrichaceae bacterium TaxID=298394 RepID=A0A6S6SL31_9GAMM|nr:MAG: Rhodanese-like protein [uncultured Thiotrichaceae bacterium]
MTQKTYRALVVELLPHIKEILPWDLEEMLAANPDIMIIDIREPDEFAQGAIKNSILVPRGILEGACDWGYSDTIPELVRARDKPVILACRSGNRSALAAFTLQLMGYQAVYSLKMGIRGWNDYELPLYDAEGNQVDVDEMEEALDLPVSAEQMG